MHEIGALYEEGYLLLVIYRKQEEEMYGAILGDIIGSIYEQNSIKTKDFELFGMNNEFTDDTVMTIAVAEGYMFFLRDNYPDYYEGRPGLEKPFVLDEDMIPVLKNSIIRSMLFYGRKYPYVGYGRNFRRWLKYKPEPYSSWGNGSAMRTSSAAWIFDDIETVRQMAAIQSEVSHNHPAGIIGAEAIASAVFLARTGSSKDEIREYISKEFRYDLNRSVDQIRPGYNFDISCQGSVPEAIISFLDGEDFEDTVRNAISLGGDADTLGAMAGSIAEAYFGVPDELKAKCEQFLPKIMLGTLHTFSKRWQ